MNFIQERWVWPCGNGYYIMNVFIIEQVFLERIYKLVRSHSGIIGVNPNLMDCEEVPLILLNTTLTLEKEWVHCSNFFCSS
ncbi:hypothetical protein CTI12_AA624470 [Artemisia annua]|uniref:Uncharacterized protein n=1 Tax=Artemisia annua TaxID=35608 RepID=A0A2U1KAV0_ARTAN|nr:hypothetical protein CTI12_AA624470 [Artemisia annua]